jgi:hypothetical protein
VLNPANPIGQVNDAASLIVSLPITTGFAESNTNISVCYILSNEYVMAKLTLQNKPPQLCSLVCISRSVS